MARSAEGATVWVSAGIAVAIAAVIVVTINVWQERSLHTEPGHPRRAFLVEGKQSPYLVLVDDVHAGHGVHAVRYAAIDTSTGKLVSELPIPGGAYTCWPATEARMWCDAGDDVVLLSVPE